MTKSVVPEVSIIVTFHNNADYVDAAIAMIDAQTFRGAELLLVDDGSTDGTAEALGVAAGSRPHAEVLAFSPNQGVASARNRAVAHARGEYIWFVDCDDLWDPGILSALVDAARETGSDIVACRAVRATSADDRETRPLDGMAVRTTVGHLDAIRALVRRQLRGYLWNKLIRRELFGTDPFPPLQSQSDFAGVIVAVSRATSVTFLPDVLYTHLVRPGSITNGRDPDLGTLKYCRDRVRELALESGAYSPGDPELELFDYAEYYVAAIDTFYRSGSTSDASRAHLREIRREVTPGGILRVARRAPLVGAAGLAYKVLGGGFGLVYRIYRRLPGRAALRG